MTEEVKTEIKDGTRVGVPVSNPNVQAPKPPKKAAPMPVTDEVKDPVFVLPTDVPGALKHQYSQLVKQYGPNDVVSKTMANYAMEFYHVDVRAK